MFKNVRGGGGEEPPIDPQLQVTLSMLYIFSWQYVSFKINFSGTLRPSQGVWGTGEKGIYFRGIGEQRTNFKGNKNDIGEQGT